MDTNRMSVQSCHSPGSLALQQRRPSTELLLSLADMAFFIEDA